MYSLKGTFIRASKINFIKSLETYLVEAIYKKYCTVSPSTGAGETYEWLGGLPGLKEWVGARQIEALEKFSYTLTNKKYEDTLGFDTDKLEDNPAIVKAQIPLLTKAAADSIDEQFFDKVIAGATDLCFDGKAFYATDHPAPWEDGTPFSNKITGGGVTVDLIKADFSKVKLAFLGFKKRNGRSLFKGIKPGALEIFHAPALESVFEEVFMSERIAATGVRNLYYRKATPVPCADLSGNDWYAHKVDNPLKPFIYQLRKKLKPEWDLTETFKRGKVFFGVDGRWVFGFTIPQLSIMVDNT